ncbi:DUF2218 domain-containing protein [uncultured Ramlibacter sp.]|uniref:DUF2218 domain-containing protein n=1 Tax=uncultured Ramlibacter sp. TaxID=260755 RepID=UPI0026168915|nr:DUF2218 domain-containing protein [uncultured Ramlibacter sp.]
MLQLKGRVSTPEASRYMQRLCYHFSKKIQVSYDEHQGHAQFPWGTCRFTAESESLGFDCEAASIEELARVKFAIDEHIKLFSRKSPLQVAWEPAIGS